MFDEKRRSELMSSIRGQNTGAERIVFAYLRKQNIYFQKHYKHIEGKPDIALPRKRIAVFIDGDFWHGRELKRLIDRGGSKYWIDKINTNIARDQKTNKVLADKGWKVLRVWESDIKRKKTRQEELNKIAKLLKK